MKKTLLYSAIAGALILASVSPFCLKAEATCPIKAPCEKQFDKPMKPNLQEHTRPALPPKMKEDKKAEFEERLNLTASQKATLEKIKAEEKLAIDPIREELKNEQEKIDALISKERAVRAESMKKFDSMLNAKQKQELEKIKQEVKEEMEKMAPPPPPPCDCGQACPPKCGCGCHEKK